MAKVLMEKLNKHYGEVKAVKDLDLEIPDKEFVVLVGPSGCGKTTTLRMVAGLEDITAGDIYIDDKVVNHLPPKDRDIAMVFQNYALYPHMTVYQNMAFAIDLAEVPQGGDRPAGEGGGGNPEYRRAVTAQSPRRCPGGSGRGWRWGERSCGSRRYSCSMSLFRTWMRS